MLFDTGSQVSLVSPVILPCLEDFSKKCICNKSVNGGFLKVLGTGNLVATLQGNTFRQKVIVVVGVRHPDLLGMDFILSHVDSINLQEGTMKFLKGMDRLV